jgi:hypothetical protein
MTSPSCYIKVTGSENSATAEIVSCKPRIARRSNDPAAPARQHRLRLLDVIVPRKRGILDDNVIDIVSVRAAVEARVYVGYSEIEIFSNDWWRAVAEGVGVCARQSWTV